MGRPHNNYSDTQKSAALIAYDICENNAVRAAQWCKDHNGFSVSHDQIMRWANGVAIHPEVRQIAERKKGELSDKFLDIAHLCTDIAHDKLSDPDQRQDIPFEKLITAGAIATDKYRLLTEQSTQNVQHTLSNEERLARLQELMRVAQERKALAEAEQPATIEAEFESEENE